MLKKLLVIFFLISINSVSAENKKNILINLKKTENLMFNFEHNINENIEIGNCTIKYPKKINCKYENNNNKILVSNGKSIVIKTITSYYIYPLDKTPLNIILDKNLISKKINETKEVSSNSSYIEFKIKENDTEVKIFFDKLTFNLIGWQTKDIYKNISSTYLSSIKINQTVDDQLFKLPLQN